MQRKKQKNVTRLKKADYYDYNLLAAVILLMCFGLVMLYSTSAYEAQLTFKGNDMYYFSRQALRFRLICYASECPGNQFPIG